MSKYTYSASQVKTFRDCKRKWAFDKIDRVPRGASSINAVKGNLLHELLENYLKTGEMPSPDKTYNYSQDGQIVASMKGDEATSILLPGIKHLPVAGTVQVEDRFEIDLGHLGKIIGYVDFENDDRELPLVGDHKTTSDIGYALTAEELVEDPQAIIYATKKLKETNAKKVLLRWVYYQTKKKKPKSKKTEAVMTAAQVEKGFHGILFDIQEMKALRDSGKSANEIEYNLDVCDKYRGCQYREICKIPKAERIKGAMTVNKELLAKINAMKAGKAEAANVEPPAVNPPESDMAERIAAKVQEKKTKAAPAKKVVKKKATKKKATKKTAVPDFVTGMTLYLNCRPVKGQEATDFVELLAKVNEKVLEQTGVFHYRQIPDLFGKGPAVLQEMLSELPMPSNVVLYTDMPEAKDAYAYLVNEASVVVSA